MGLYKDFYLEKLFDPWEVGNTDFRKMDICFVTLSTKLQNCRTFFNLALEDECIKKIHRIFYTHTFCKSVSNAQEIANICNAIEIVTTLRRLYAIFTYQWIVRIFKGYFSVANSI